MERRETYWSYWKCSGTMVGSTNIRHNYSSERWELVHDSGHRHFLYDARNEFDGVITFTRTEMIFHEQGGEERHYPRVLDLWDIWFDHRKASGERTRHRSLAADREEHQRRITARMQERGISISPAKNAQRRPPVLKSPVVATASPKQVPLFAVTEFGYGNNTGTVYAVYADGTVICRSLPENPAAPYHQLKVPNAAQFIREQLGADFLSQPDKIRLSDATDQLITTVWTPEKTLEIYGRWREPDSSWGPPAEWTDADKQFNERMKERWDSVLAGIRPTLRKIDDLRSVQGINWLPPQIEVIFSEYENAVDQPIDWPSEWPGLYADTSIKRQTDCYSVYVPAADLGKLTAFLDTRRERGAVMIDLNQMSPSVRFPFPSENTWLKHVTAW